MVMEVDYETGKNLIYLDFPRILVIDQFFVCFLFFFFFCNSQIYTYR